jgi:hypothetical protein
MKKIRGIFWVVASALLAAYGASAAAQAVEEVEPNYAAGTTDPMSAAQPLTIGSDGTVTVNGFLEPAGTVGFAVDVFSFYARTASADHPEADVITVDINGGIKAGAGSVDTSLAIHGPAPDYTALSWNEDRSTDDWDPYISNRRIDEDGVYYVVVTGGQNRVADGGVTLNDGFNRESGTYTLIISGVSPTAAPAPTPGPTPDPTPDPTPVKPISIEIKPGRGTVMTRMNPNASGTIPVALLSSYGFNALEVDESSLRFGHSGDESSLHRCDKRGRDVNGDGLLDKVCHFDNRAAKFEMTDDKGFLKGTIAGKPFEGNGMLKVIPEKRRGHRRDGDNRHDRDDRGDRRHR